MLSLSKFSWISLTHRVVLRIRAFMRAPWAGGVVLLTCVVVAMLLANLPFTKFYYHHLLETELSLLVHSPGGGINWAFPSGMTVEKFINDGLMVIFFFSVGLEIKREVVRGQLSTWRKAILPVVAAAGGMLAPAIIYTCFNYGTPAASGWGIPTATDIAFAVGILTMLETRIPVSLRIFLMALAVADDLGAILVIALFYGEEVRLGYLLIALLIIVVMVFVIPIGSPTGGDVDNAFTYSMLTAYNTGDIPTGLICAGVFLGSVKGKGYNTYKDQKYILVRSILVSLVILFVVYGGLCWLGACGTPYFDSSMDHLQ